MRVEIPLHGDALPAMFSPIIPMAKKLLFTLFLLAAMHSTAAAQRMGVWSAAFYNLENIFDCEDDPNNSGDDEFLPEGPYQWTEDKYEQKLGNMARTIALLARDNCPGGPAVIGISEVENERVVRDLVARPELAQMGLKYVHYESPDRRGIDVALLYNPRLFKLSSSKAYPYRLKSNPKFVSRDQLVVSGTMAGEPVSIIVGHWPSRYGGKKSYHLRDAAAELSKHIADSICAASPANKVIIMGDFNDDPKDHSCAVVLGAARKRKDAKNKSYFNATWPLYDKGIGSLCYQDVWCLYDQQVVSSNFLEHSVGAPESLTFWKAEVFNRDFLTTQEGKKKGYPRRSFVNNVWQNGYSDHYPTITYFVKLLK